MSSFNTNFTITRDEASILVSITSGEIFAWEATNTQIDTVDGGDRFIIGANIVNNGIDLDLTQSTDPGVTGGTIRTDYINTILGLVNDARSAEIAVTSSTALDVNIVSGVLDGGIIGITSAAPIEIFGGITSALALSITSDVGPLDVTIVGGGGGGGTIDGIVGITGGPIVVNGIVGITGDLSATVNIDVIGVTSADGLLNDIIGITESVSFNRIVNEFDLDLSNDLLSDKICFNMLAFSNMLNTDSDDLNESSSDSDDGGGGVGDGFNFFETADTVDVISNNANDDGTGSRARTVTIEGLDASFNEQTETVTLVGNGTATTTNSFIRINKAFVASSGTYHETNQRDISLRRNTGGLKYVTIKKKIGRSRTGVYTVPTGKTAFVTDIHASSNSQRRFALKLYKLEGADDVTVPVNSPEVIYQTAHIENSNSMICYVKVPQPLKPICFPSIWNISVSGAPPVKVSPETPT